MGVGSANRVCILVCTLQQGYLSKEIIGQMSEDLYPHDVCNRKGKETLNVQQLAYGQIVAHSFHAMNHL